MSSAHDQSERMGQQSEGSGQYVPRPAWQQDDTRQTSGSGGLAVAGFTAVAAVFMVISGLWSFFEGLAAIIKGGFFVVAPNYAYDISTTGWGWMHLVLGVVVFLAGLCLFADMTWARVTGIILATISAVLNFLYIPYYPVWSIVVIALDVFVIWALMSPRRRYV
ncbi:MAG TPA: hypothetical protein VGG16_07775 [Streptosporangiaceae bacterium]|jgi:hypothetical protein